MINELYKDGDKEGLLARINKKRSNKSIITTGTKNSNKKRNNKTVIDPETGKPKMVKASDFKKLRSTL